MREPTQEEVLAFYDWMSTNFGIDIISKDDAFEMKAVASFLQLIGIQNAEDFMELYWTTIPFGLRGNNKHTMYLPTSMKGVWPEHMRWSFAMVGFHEVVHPERAEQQGRMRFAFDYLANRQLRANEEAFAFSGDLLAEVWRHGVMPPATRRTRMLDHYGCNGRNIDVATLGLESAMATIEHGGSLSPAAMSCARWWSRNAPQVRDPAAEERFPLSL